ncbi:glycosyltransferase family 9 protein [Streptomyces sp. WAC05374]|uniref:glycosyltransferase family 9 protein n=1 Tax=Streptomyces sp. WAC05374 TaxID=2487420 RepID=UPI000F87A6D6|nr:glycosyltransferase family 9 protein [Streptomyces sp. WAC05374]RST19202.1 glycosyltransferase family 9 protein [Streptomyces sp. WAC05374]TDF50467.1 glycosyltransferase family 9 protein [Streptomyces sp. WAC05374]TDF51834.1 glycosyltransferase family 9 protein [Streptomyces sp. WAC05374]TDF60720.1 glycosyltransferase family 9 protein [Streptomyces sp. WAC05374]
MRALVVRLDSFGDVLLAGPAVRAVAHRADRVALLCGPRGAPAARLLPGVDEVLVWDAPWVGLDPPRVERADVDRVVGRIAAARADAAVVLTSFHQSPLPAALLLRMAGVGHIAADSVDFPGSLLDVRHRRAPDAHEAEAALDLAEAAGFPRPPGDDGRLRVRHAPGAPELTGPGPYVVVHPGASVAARRWSPERCAHAVRLLAGAGHRVVVTGGPDERELTALVAGRDGLDLGGRTQPPQLAAVLAAAGAVVTGNTGPAHLAAAVGTPIVSLFSPVVPAGRWGPYGVPHVLLGDQSAPCAGSRARECPVPGHPCLDRVTAEDVLAAVEKLLQGNDLLEDGAWGRA